MSSQSEVGHAKNVANLQKLTERIATYTLYNPPVPSISVASLETLYTDATASISEVENTRIANKGAIYDRQVLFDDLKPICTRIINLLDIMGLSDGLFSQAKSLNKIIQGTSPKPASPPPPEGEGGISTSRQSYTQQAENFGTFIKLLSTIPEYTPNEDDLKVPSLITYKDALVNATKPVDQTEAVFKQKLLERNEILYAEATGLFDLAQNVKKYVKSVYGGDSPEYFNVSSIKFTDRPQ